MLITIIVPCYNEKNTLEKLILKLNILKKIKKQIIIIDDGSTDGTTEIIKNKLKKVNKVIFHKKILEKAQQLKVQ